MSPTEESINISTPFCLKFCMSLEIKGHACFCAKLLQLCPVLYNPRDCGPPGSSVHGILQASILEWVAQPPPRDLLNPGIESMSLKSPAL